MDRSIDYVIAIAECRSISKAAEILYISQPSLSRYLSNLENELGVNLFIRTLNGTELTEAGKIYLEYAREIKLLRSTMNLKIREFRRAKKDRIRIGMTLNAASLAAFDIAKEVRKKYPDCEVEIYNILSKDTEKMLRDGLYDFVIGPNWNLSSEFDYELLYQDPYVLIVPDQYNIEAYAKYQGDNILPFVSLNDLPPMDFIFQDETTAVRKGINKIMKHMKTQIVPKMVVASSTLALQAAENRIGCCIVGVGHLTYINHGDHIKVYQVSGQELSPAGVISLNTKILSAEERYCISAIKRALLEGEEEILKEIKRSILSR